MSGLVLLVTGGRSFTDRDILFAELDRIVLPRGPSLLIEGGQRTKRGQETIGGADYWANRWAVLRRIPFKTVRASWHDLTTPPVRVKRAPNGIEYNALAGFVRNQRMVDMKPGLVVAFKGGKGTKDCVTRAKAAGIEVIEVRS